VKPRAFDYLRPDTVEEALATLAEHGEGARILAGGQSLVAMLNFRLVEPGLLIDIAGLEALDFIRVVDGALEVGAAVTQNRLLSYPGLGREAPLLALALPWVGHFQTRNRGTVCGSLAHADPSAEIPLALAVLGGEVVLRSVRGERRVAAAAFQAGMLATARAPDELVVAARFPLRADRRCAFRETARRHGDFAIVAVAAVVEPDGAVRLGAGGIADRPAVRRIEPRGDDAVAAEINHFAWELGGYDDMHASPRYRRDLLRRMGTAVIDEALKCAA
jgi:2-furoyl-CoA dehydrogenase FAD binding subunit